MKLVQGRILKAKSDVISVLAPQTGISPSLSLLTGTAGIALIQSVHFLEGTIRSLPKSRWDA